MAPLPCWPLQAATGGGLVVLILIFGPVSGAHFNPAVTLAAATQGVLPWREVLPYIAIQVLGAFAGVAAAHLMFGEPLFFASLKVRTSGAQWWSEFIATFGLLMVIWGCVRQNITAVPYAGGVHHIRLLVHRVHLLLPIPLSRWHVRPAIPLPGSAWRMWRHLSSRSCLEPQQQPRCFAGCCPRRNLPPCRVLCVARQRVEPLQGGPAYGERFPPSPCVGVSRHGGYSHPAITPIPVHAQSTKSPVSSEPLRWATSRRPSVLRQSQDPNRCVSAR